MRFRAARLLAISKRRFGVALVRAEPEKANNLIYIFNQKWKPKSFEQVNQLLDRMHATSLSQLNPDFLTRLRDVFVDFKSQGDGKPPACVANASCFTKTFWGLVKFNVLPGDVDPVSVLDSLGVGITQYAEKLHPTELTNLAWALSQCYRTWGGKHPSLKGSTQLDEILTEIARLSQDCLHRFTHKELSSFVWSMAWAEYKNPRFWGEVAENVVERLREAKEEDKGKAFGWIFRCGALRPYVLKYALVLVSLVDAMGSMKNPPATDVALIVTAIDHLDDGQLREAGGYLIPAACNLIEKATVHTKPSEVVLFLDFLSRYGRRTKLLSKKGHDLKNTMETLLREHIFSDRPLDRKEYEKDLLGLKVVHLGENITRLLLQSFQCKTPDDEFISTAKLRLRQHLHKQATVTQKFICCYLEASLTSPTERSRVCEFKDIFTFSENNERNLDMLKTVRLKHARDGHCEVLALEAILASILSYPCWQDTEGTVQLYINYAPCLSCVGAILQFIKMLPRVHVKVDYYRVVPFVARETLKAPKFYNNHHVLS